ncbi:hypothetical protein BDR05DRAFT_993565 [Suillus weaverae]|nr:hypothetical protein BDR05DRAFT_993565 [Suillus weaverae]
MQGHHWWYYLPRLSELTTAKTTPPPSLESKSEDNVEVSKPQRSKKAHIVAKQSDVNSDSASKQSTSDSGTEESDMDSESVKSIAEALFGEVPTIISAQANHQQKPAKRGISESGRPQKTTNTQYWSPTPPPPVWGSQYQYKPLHVKEKRCAAEIPMWDSIMMSSSFESQPPKCASKSHKPSAIEVKEDEVEDISTLDIKPEPNVSLQVSAMADLVYMKTRSVWLTDQNIELHKVIQHGILEVKAYIAFKHGYPELMAKNSYAWEILLQAAKRHKTEPIEKQMYVDDDYLSALATLIDAHIFDADGLPSPKCQKPYQGPPVIDTLYEIFFKNMKSVGLQFAQHFVDIAKNKAGQPEILIPMLAIVSTAIHAALIAKKNKVGNDFKFTSNQFCDIYTYHMALLEKIQTLAPIKFHKLMADIYEEVQHFHHNATGAYDQDVDLALLDLDGMNDE